MKPISFMYALFFIFLFITIAFSEEIYVKECLNSNINVRSRSTEYSRSEGVVAPGQKLIFHKEKNGWSFIETEPDETKTEHGTKKSVIKGWVKNTLLTETESRIHIISKLKENIAELNTQINGMNAKTEKLNRIISTLNNDQADLQKTIKNCQEKNTSLEKERNHLSGYKQKYEDIQIKYDQTSRLLKQKNIFQSIMLVILFLFFVTILLGVYYIFLMKKDKKHIHL